MDTLLHGKIGYLLGKELVCNGFSKINIASFVYGNILPDLSFKYRVTMHSKNVDWNMVLKIIDEISYNKEKINENISIKLGILTHYLCDFFTFPHNEVFKKTIIHHEIYEQSQRLLIWGKLSKIWDECRKEINVELKSKNDIINYIEDMHSIYIKNSGDKNRDILFSNILVRVVCTSILKIRYNQEILSLDEKVNEIDVMVI
ncbi:zinc dependent phospholipase C family protein [Clostridium sp.]|uniref:zinc dependent phospholipase C family protein n=1 Tax=Clostridium sp. TaxID=1506 RepID=UPI00284448B5|nr:zinc dependent phospholipase C family protein [Clostridium sp.]MDR3596952.1 zinc dependent phospholipase C family protein [Clostridium sp.]